MISPNVIVYLRAVYCFKSLHVLTHLILKAIYEVGSISISTAFLQIRTVEHREPK